MTIRIDPLQKPAKFPVPHCPHHSLSLLLFTVFSSSSVNSLSLTPSFRSKPLVVIMPRESRESPNVPRPPSPGSWRYKFASAIVEDKSSDPPTTYGVQFCLRPSTFHLQGGGAVWKAPPPTEDGDHLDTVTPVELDIAPNKQRYGRKDTKWRNLFVTCSGLVVRVYEARSKQKPNLLQAYEDADHDEQFYCVAWTYNANGNHEWWVCAAGKKGVLRIINVTKGKLESSLTGHGEAINDVKVHPRDSSLVITASKDESLRLWNLRTGSTIAVFAGLKGHRGEVVHVDFDRLGDRFASCGIDNSVRIWHIKEDPKVVEAIRESHVAADLGIKDTYVYKDETGTRKRTKVPVCQFPYFVTRKVHKHYVDCVMWVGDLLLSKSVHNRIFLWEPGSDRESLASPANEYTLLEEYVLDVCHVWFIRFAMDRSRRLVACGNDKVSLALFWRIMRAIFQILTSSTTFSFHFFSFRLTSAAEQGVVSVFDLQTYPSKPMCVLQPATKDKNRFNFVRQCAFSDDGSFLLAVDDGSSVMQYERC